MRKGVCRNTAPFFFTWKYFYNMKEVMRMTTKEKIVLTISILGIIVYDIGWGLLAFHIVGLI